ncbi:hypothetical protein Ancab_017782 [Ancistrocladus abbreviatus]
MQLQSLQNPLSFVSNAALWPKLHPLQERMLQQLQPMNQETANHPARESLNGSTSSNSSMAFNGGNNLMESTMIAKSECLEESNYNPEMQIQAELNDLVLSNNNGQVAESDCFKEMDPCFKGEYDELVDK